MLLGATLFVSVDRQVLAHHSTPASGLKEPKRRAVQIPIPDFSLTDQNAGNFQFSKLRGKLILLSFAYTTCPDLCPLVTTSMRSVQKQLNASERDRVFFLSLTTDPEIDKPPVLKSYGKRYGVDFSNWSFLTGEKQELAPVWRSFGVVVRREARGLVDHTLLTALVDAKGVMRFIYHGAAPDPRKILQDLRSLLFSR